MSQQQQYYSLRNGLNPLANGIPLDSLLMLFGRLYKGFRVKGYFDEVFGFYCVDAGDVAGTLEDPDLDIFLALRKEHLFPIETYYSQYSEDDLLDIIEYLYQKISKPVDGFMHTHNECGMHWETFNKKEGQDFFVVEINKLLSHYEIKFELSKEGLILSKVDEGFQNLFTADIPTSDEENIKSRVDKAIKNYRRHGSSVDDRKQAVRDLADVLEYLKPAIKNSLNRKDESFLFELINNYGIRHHSKSQKTDYDANIWLSWMFYYFLATIQAIVRFDNKINKQK
ncbi:hypothetical protein [Acidovorax sp. CCYZU-2555]|uniref:hypothetical protein n=1 Tax=Acidovorax sp. CCYZU-2555 TaxID=2835042 RepID=UPI0020BE9EDF|nr:hypothetical protein [Acidovorax sp. CCYZU-2555]